MTPTARHSKQDVSGHNAEETLEHFAGGEAAALAMPPVLPRAEPVASRSHRWGVILAGGDGVRLRPLTKLICGDERPKQFCPIFGGRTLLQQTLLRSAWTIPNEQILVSLSRRHSEWYAQEASLRPSQRVVQPANKGTAPPILHSLLSVGRLDAEALVAILPCDHHYADEDSFHSALECAFETAEARRDAVILLGAKPDYPEIEYGWIELGEPLGHDSGELFWVRKFWEKPAGDIAVRLLDQGSVWNTFVMVGRVSAFLEVIRAALPDLHGRLASASLWTGAETHIESSVYKNIPSVNFSHEVLSAETDRLLVLRLNDVGWSDLGDPGRAFIAARGSGCEPEWIRGWPSVKGRKVLPASCL